MSRRRNLTPCDASGQPANIGTRLWSSSDTGWAGFPFEVYRLHDQAVFGETFQNSTLVALCLSGKAEMAVQVGTRDNEAISSEGALVMAGFGLEYRSMDWRGATDVLFLDLDIEKLYGQPGHLSSEINPIHHFMIRDNNITAIVLRMVAEAKEYCESGALYAQSLSAALAAYISSHYTSRPAPSRRTAKFSHAQSNRIQEFVNAHLADDISLRDLASTAQLSPSRFAEIFKHTFECAPHQYVIHRRIAVAMRLLAETSLPISEITQLTGFSDQSHLTTVFRKVTNTTPRQYQLARCNA